MPSEVRHLLSAVDRLTSIEPTDVGQGLGPRCSYLSIRITAP
jgi:hypothetical protein